MTVWTVDYHMDRMREVESDKAKESQPIFAGSTQRRYEIFPTKRDALDFMVVRAYRAFQKANKELAAADRRLKKCEKLQRENFKL